MTSITNEVTLDQFHTKSAGLPDFATQDVFMQMASVSDGMSPTYGNDMDMGMDLSNG